MRVKGFRVFTEIFDGIIFQFGFYWDLYMNTCNFTFIFLQRIGLSRFSELFKICFVCIHKKE
jgi:hypothetical protein